MSQVKLVAPDYVHQVWGIIEPMLKRAFINFDNADYDVNHLKVLVIKQYQYLFVVTEDNKIIGAFTVEVFNQPNDRIAHTTCMGGKGLFNSNFLRYCNRPSY